MKERKIAQIGDKIRITSGWVFDDVVVSKGEVHEVIDKGWFEKPTAYILKDGKECYFYPHEYEVIDTHSDEKAKE